MNKTKVRVWFILVVCCPLAFVGLEAWWSQTLATQGTVRQALDSEYLDKCLTASTLVHEAIGTYNWKTRKYDPPSAMLPGSTVATNLPEKLKLRMGYPVLVTGVNDETYYDLKEGIADGWAGPPLRVMGDKFYTGIENGKLKSAEIYSDEFYRHLDKLRWVIVLSYGVLDTKNYRIAGGRGNPNHLAREMNNVSSTENNLFTDGWMIDLKAMKIAAHKRFKDEPLPDVIRYKTNGNGISTDEYEEAQNKRLNKEIASWILKNSQ